jgi:hypothetical protein
MLVSFTKEQEEKLLAITKERDWTIEETVKDMLESYLDENIVSSEISEIKTETEKPKSHIITMED